MRGDYIKYFLVLACLLFVVCHLACYLENIDSFGF